MTDKKPTPKELWKDQVSEYLHNCFIGISNLTCSEENCPLVLNWDDIEEKNSKKGKCALYQVNKSDNKYLVVDLTDTLVENDLGEWENIEIKFKSGKTQRTKPTEYVELKKKEKGLFSFISGILPNEPKPPKEIFLKDEEFVLFFNNSAHTPNLGKTDNYLEDMWDIREDIKWDREASKKKIINWVEGKPDGQDKANKIGEWKDDYIFYVYDPDITNEIKAHEVYSPSKGTEERKQLWTDYKEELSELRRMNGIRHLTSKKDERQNNPEIELNEAQFIALERRKKRIREQSIREVEKKGFCSGTHTLSYGSLGEHQQEMIIQQQVGNLEDNNEELEKSEQKEQPNKEILVNHARKD